jgi:ribose 5-phosphate isomerase RpiB
MNSMRLGIVADHGSFGLKEQPLARMRAAGHQFIDLGAGSLDPTDDYPDLVVPLEAWAAVWVSSTACRARSPD